MRKELHPKGPTKVKEQFLFFPKTLPDYQGRTIRRWWEKAKIIRKCVHDAYGQIWVDKCWADI